MPLGFAYQNDHLYCDDVPLADIAKAVGTPVYIYSLNRLRENFTRLQEAFPTAAIHYSLKANANLAVLRFLHHLGAGFDAVSGGEVFRALKAGATPEQIVFAGVGKTAQELAFALEKGVGWINVESIEELRRLETLAGAAGKRPRVALRLNPDVHADTHKYIDTGHAYSKFGIPVAEARRILDDPPADIEIAGLHVHIGSQVGNAARTGEAVAALAPLFQAYPYLHTLDLGGGFPVSYSGEAVPEIGAFGKAVAEALAGLPHVKLILEPGRYIVADAGVLLCAVQYIKPAPDAVIVVADAGMTELLRPALYSATHQIWPIKQGQTTQKTRVVGPVCESADVIRAEVELPPLHSDDLLAVMHAGAYGAVMGSTYNARPRPPEVLVNGDVFFVARRRETWEDLLTLETQPS
jgi:diaminopimelate decarboxylase